MTVMVDIEVYGASGGWEKLTTIPASPAYGVRNALLQAVKSNTARYSKNPRARAVNSKTRELVDMEMG